MAASVSEWIPQLRLPLLVAASVSEWLPIRAIRGIRGERSFLLRSRERERVDSISGVLSIPSDLGPNHFNRGLHGFRGYQPPDRSRLPPLASVNRLDHGESGGATRSRSQSRAAEAAHAGSLSVASVASCKSNGSSQILQLRLPLLVTDVPVATAHCAQALAMSPCGRFIPMAVATGWRRSPAVFSLWP